MRDFYISYHSSDLPWAHWTAKILEDTNYSVFLRAWDSQPQLSLIQVSKQAKEVAKYLIILLSPDYLDIYSSANDWINVFTPSSFLEPGFLLPLIIRSIRYDLFLSDTLYLDLAGLRKPEARYTLLKVVRSFYSDSSTITRRKPFFYIKGLPRFWNVPYFQNPNFCGRESLLAEMRICLSSENPKRRRIVLTGHPGVGKTAVAVEYIYRYVEFYKGIWWIRAENPLLLSIDMSLLCSILKVSLVQGHTDISRYKLLCKRLEKERDWLLVFDNAIDPDVIDQHLTSDFEGQIIITSKNPQWNEHFTPLKVPPLTNAESIRLLNKSSGKSDDRETEKLIEIVGNLPLCLEQAGTFIKDQGLSYSEYRELLQSMPENLFENLSPIQAPLNNLKNKSPTAYEILCLISFFEPSDIPMQILIKGKQHLPQYLLSEIKDERDLVRIIRDLQRYSLVEFTEGFLSFQKQILRYVHNKLEFEEKRNWLNAALKILNDAFEFDKDNPETWQKGYELLPHALTIVDFAEEYGIECEILGKCLNKIGEYLLHQSEFKIAKTFVEKALSITEKTIGSENPETTNILNNLGDIFHKVGEYGKAKEYYQRALEKDKVLYDHPHPDLSRDYTKIGIILWEQNSLDQALTFFSKALEVDEEINALPNPLVARDLNNIGLVKTSKGRLEEAKSYFEKAIGIYEKMNFTDHFKMTDFLVNLGLLHIELKEYSKAQKCFERVIKARKSIFNLNHPKLANIYTCLGLVCLENGNYHEALSNFQNSLSIIKEIHGLEHPETAGILCYLGDIMIRLDNEILAYDYYRRALAICISFYGRNHPNTQYLTSKINSLKLSSLQKEE